MKAESLAGLLLRRPTTGSPDPVGYTPWLARASPEFTWDWPHLAHIRSHLADVTRGHVKRLLLSMPPQHGKTESLTVRYPVWRLVREPTLRVAITSYGQRQANKYSRKSRRVAVAAGVRISRDRNAVDEWETAAGGTFLARGVGAGITGNPVDLLVIDDPYKDAKQALSPTYRATVWDWWTDALKTRLSKDAAVVVVHTRWSTDDLIGRLEAEGGWRVVSLPALATADGDPIGRKRGEPLCPELHPLEQIEDARRGNPVSFEALYQQKPLDLEGGFFRGLERVAVVDARPAADQFEQVVRFWDLASTEASAGADPDWSVGTLMGRHRDKTFWVLDVVRVRVGPRGVRDVIRQTAMLDGVKIPVRVEREGGASGKIAADLIVREELAGWSAKAVQPEGSKAERADPFASQVEAGNVKAVRADWNREWLAELRAFPNGSHDDQVDSASGAFRAIAKPRSASTW